MEVDASGAIVGWSAGARDLFGFEAREAVGEPAWVLLTAPRAGDRDVLERALRGEVVDRYVTERRTRSGEVVPVAVCVLPTLDAAGYVRSATAIFEDLRTAEPEPRSDALLRLVLDTTSDAYVAIDEHGAISDWNPAAEELFGWPRSDAVGRALVQDVTARAHGEAHMRRLAALVESTHDAVLTEDRSGTITSWNGGAERLYGYAAEEAIGRPVAMLIPPERAGEETLIRARVFAGEPVEHYETARVTRDGDHVDVSLTASAVRDVNGRIVETSTIARDISARRRAERELERYLGDLEALALQDPLTGLLTRRELYGILDRELSRAAHEGVPCSLLLVDVDGLHHVNDRKGREAGDHVLRELADVVRSCCRGDEVACRLGDDEIAVVVPTGAGPAMALAQRITTAWAERLGAVGISTGVATFPSDAAEHEELVERARDALRFAKPAPPAGRAAASGARDTSADGAPDTADRILALLRRHLGMEVAYLTEFVGDEQVVRLADAAPERPDIARGTTIALERSVCRRMLRGELPNVVPDTAADPVTAELDVTREAGIGSYVGVPVRLSDGRLYGTLCCASREPTSTDQSATHFARVCARLIADLMEQRDLEAHNRRLQAELTGVRALLAALDARDHYTGAHSEAVVALALAVARRLRLGPDETTAVEQVALLHDIGKIGVPDGILQKPGALDADEWQVMRTHPAIGAQIVASIASLSHLAPAIRAEHERWDGEGYPDGLAGYTIPLASRIILACDALHAMTSDRPYRAAMPLGAAVEELRANAGAQFDPAVIAALVAEVAVDEDAAAGADRRERPVVLAVEDNAAFRLALEHGLASEGFEVTAVASAADAYRAAESLHPDLILLDWILPGGDNGLAACRRFRQSHPGAVVAVLSGLGDHRDQRAALDAGATVFLQKGVPLATLADRLRRLLGDEETS